MESTSSPKKSKRGAFRIKCCEHPVYLKTADDEGTACLTDLSSSGCSLNQASCKVGLHEKVLVDFSLGESKERLEASGKVVRLCSGGFALEFGIMDTETYGTLRAYFIKQLREDSGHSHNGQTAAISRL